MTPQLSAHLSEEAVNDVLIGMASAESKAHLAVCSICRSQVEDFYSDMQLFNRASLAWGEARPHRPIHRPRLGIGLLAPAGLALAAALLVAIGLPAWNHDHRASLNHAATAPSAAGDSEAQIAQDNELLRSVDAALNENEASPVSEYQMSDGPHARVNPRRDLRNP